MPYKVPTIDNNLHIPGRELMSDSLPEQHMPAIECIQLGAEEYHLVASDSGLWQASLVEPGPEAPDEDDLRKQIMTLGFDTVSAAEALVAVIEGRPDAPRNFVSINRPRKPLSPQTETKLLKLDRRNVVCNTAARLWQLVQPHVLMYPQPEAA